MIDSNSSVFLVGMPGCGKSTLGKAFVKVTDFSFIDTDDAIIAEQQKSIEQIYHEVSEIGFRKVEHNFIEKLEPKSKTIICTGGGFPCFFGNMEIMKTKGIVVFIDVSPNEIYNRIKDTNFTGRPIYQNKTPKQIQEIIAKVLIERRPIYETAHIILKGDDLLVDDLIKALESY